MEARRQEDALTMVWSQNESLHDNQTFHSINIKCLLVCVYVCVLMQHHYKIFSLPFILLDCYVSALMEGISISL